MFEIFNQNSKGCMYRWFRGRVGSTAKYNNAGQGNDGGTPAETGAVRAARPAVAFGVAGGGMLARACRGARRICAGVPSAAAGRRPRLCSPTLLSFYNIICTSIDDLQVWDAVAHMCTASFHM